MKKTEIKNIEIRTSILIIGLTILFTTTNLITLYGQVKTMGPKLIVPTGHSDNIWCLAVSPDKKLIASGSIDETIVLWNTASASQISNFTKNNGMISDVLFTNDGNELIYCTFDSTIRVLDLKTGIISKKMKDSNLSKAILYVNKQQIIISGDLEGGLTSWNKKTGGIVKNLKYGGDFNPRKTSVGITSLSLSLDEKVFLSSSFDSKVNLRNTTTLKSLLVFNHGGPVQQVVFCPDNHTFFSIISDTLYQWSTVSNKAPIFKLGIETTVLHSLTISPDGNFLAIGAENEIIVFDVKKRKTHKIITGQEGRIASVAFINNKEFVASGYLEGNSIYNKTNMSLKVWNIDNSTISKDLAPHTYEVNRLEISKDGKKIITATTDGRIHLWDLNMANKVSFAPHTGLVNAIHFLRDANKIVTAGDDGWIKLIDVKGNRVSKQIQSSFGKIDKLSIWKDTDSAICAFWENNNFEILDLRSFNFLPSLQLRPHTGVIMALGIDSSQTIFSAADNLNIDLSSLDKINRKSSHFRIGQSYILSGFDFSKDYKFGASGSHDHSIKILKIDPFEELSEIKLGYERTVVFADNSAVVAFGSKDDDVVVYNWKKNQELAKLSGHSNALTGISFYSNDKMLASTSIDNTLKIWNLTKNEQVATFIAIDSNDYIILLPNGYFKASKSAISTLSYNVNNTNVSIAQLEIKYNRPDLVLNALGSTDTLLIMAYKKAYDKRLKKLNIDTLQLGSGYSVPIADFKNRANIQYAQKKDQLSLRISGTDDKYSLDRFNVWVNQVPIFGLKGASLKHRRSKNIDTTLIIKLSQGENRIETSITNSNGAESYHIPLYVRYAGLKKQKLYFIGIGLDNYSNSRYNLQWSINDIRGLASKFKAKYKDNCIIDTLFDQDVTINKVNMLKKKLLLSNVDDIVVIAYSGHGLLSKNYDYYLSSYLINFDLPEKQGIPYDALENLLDKIPSRKKLMLIDACHSGEIDKEEIAKYKQVMAHSNNKITLKGPKILIDSNQVRGKKNSFELMQELFVNSGQNTGATIISAAGGAEFAIEDGNLKHGFFTSSVLEFLNRPHCKISLLKDYVNKRVTELTLGMQVPTTRTETSISDWSLW